MFGGFFPFKKHDSVITKARLNVFSVESELLGSGLSQHAHCDFCFWNVNGQVWHEVFKRCSREEPIRPQSWSWLDPQQQKNRLASWYESAGQFLIWWRGVERKVEPWVIQHSSNRLFHLDQQASPHISQVSVGLAITMVKSRGLHQLRRSKPFLFNQDHAKCTTGERQTQTYIPWHIESEKLRKTL